VFEAIIKNCHHNAVSSKKPYANFIDWICHNIMVKVIEQLSFLSNASNN